MIENIILNYLSEKLDVPVLPEKPSRPFGSAVFIERTGGKGKYLKTTTFAVQSYADSMYGAALLNDTAVAAFVDIVELPEITHVEIDNSGQNYPDLETKTYRYQAVITLTHY